MANWSSLRLRDGPIGAIGSLLVALGITLVAAAPPFGATKTVYIVFLLFPPAIFGAIYSLFFERSKLYGTVAILLGGMALLVQPFTWYWLKLYLPLAAVFILFCSVINVLRHQRTR